MKCDQFHIAAHAFVMGELDAALDLEAAVHVDQCAHCARNAKAVRWFKLLLRRAWEGELEAPPHLRERIHVSLGLNEATLRADVALYGVAHGRNSRRHKYAALLGVAAALAAATGLWRWTSDAGGGGGRPGTVARIVTDVREQHRSCIRLRGAGHHDQSLSRDLETIAVRLSERLGLAVLAPDLSADGFSLLGADACGILGRRGAHVLYSAADDGVDLSVYTVERLAAIEPDSQRQEGHSGFLVDTDGPETVVAWNESRQTYISCGRIPRLRMIQIMRHVRLAAASTAARPLLAMVGKAAR
ncbi:MAG: anti-sigma factor family protein [Phycisphaerae bacterium]